MKAEHLNYGEKILKILNEIGEVSFKTLEEKTTIKGEELRELLKYLVKKEFISWRMPLFIGTFGEPINILEEDKIKLAHKGMEVVLGKRDFFEEGERPNQINVSNSSDFQLAQNIGDNASINQIKDSPQIIVLKQLIEDDPELNVGQKTELKSVVDKIKEGVSTGEKIEKVYEWVKRGIGVCAKYGPYLFELIKGL